MELARTEKMIVDYSLTDKEHIENPEQEGNSLARYFPMPSEREFERQVISSEKVMGKQVGSKPMEYLLLNDKVFVDVATYELLKEYYPIATPVLSDNTPSASIYFYMGEQIVGIIASERGVKKC